MSTNTHMELRNLARAGDPIGRLRAIHRLRVEADEMLDLLEHEAVLAARSARKTWEDIGRALGVSTSAALRKHDPTAKR